MLVLQLKIWKGKIQWNHVFSSDSFISGTVLSFFLIFCHDFQGHTWKKLTARFLVKIHVDLKLVQNGPKWAQNNPTVFFLLFLQLWLLSLLRKDRRLWLFKVLGKKAAMVAKMVCSFFWNQFVQLFKFFHEGRGSWIF